MSSKADTITNGGGRRSLTDRLIDPNVSRPVTAGLAPYLPEAARTKVFKCEVEEYARRLIRSKFGFIADDSFSPDLIEEEVANTRLLLAEKLGNEYREKIHGTDISLESIRTAYEEIVSALMDERINTNSDKKNAQLKLPQYILDLMRQGRIFATEDFKGFVDEDRARFVHESYAIPPASQNALMISKIVDNAVKEFQKLFDKANVMLLAKLGMILPDESNDQASDRIDVRIGEAVKFLEEIHRLALVYQLQNIKEWKKARQKAHENGEDFDIPQPKVLSALAPKDLVFKRFSDLAELVFYPHNFPVSENRRFVAQQIMMLTLLYDQIHRDPMFVKSTELARRLHNLLNHSLVGGRIGRRVEGVFIDENGNKSLKEDAQYCSVAEGGIRQFQLEPKVIDNDGHPVTLFPNGQWVTVESRVKTPPSIVLKKINKDMAEVTDHVAFDFVIDSRNMSPDELCQIILDMKDYLKNIWNISEFPENKTGITNPSAAVKDNEATSSSFVTEKVVFYKEIGDTKIAVEVQFKTLQMKLEAESTNSPASHHRYRTDQAVKAKAFADLFPKEIFGDFSAIADAVQGSLSDTLKSQATIEDRV